MTDRCYIRVRHGPSVDDRVWQHPSPPTLYSLHRALYTSYHYIHIYKRAHAGRSSLIPFYLGYHPNLIESNPHLQSPTLWLPTRSPLPLHTHSRSLNSSSPLLHLRTTHPFWPADLVSMPRETNPSYKSLILPQSP